MAVSVLMIFATLTGTGCATSIPDADLLVENVHIIDVVTGDVLEDRTIAVKNGTIVHIGPASRLGKTRSSRNLTRIDADGAFAIPGLWDAHLHVIQEDTEYALDVIAPRALSYGITYARDLGSSLDARASVLTALDRNPAGGPQVIASGPSAWAIDLPYGDKRRQALVQSAEEIRQLVEDLDEAGVDVIKVYSGFSPDMLRLLGSVAADAGLTLTGHAQRGVALAEAAAAGLNPIEHADFTTFQDCVSDARTYFDRVINARFRGSGESVLDIHIEFDGSIDEQRCTQALRRAADQGLVVTPTLGATYMTPSYFRQLNDADLHESQRASCDLFRAQFESAAAAKVQRFFDVGARMVARLRENGIPILAGSDAPIFCNTPGLSLLWELQMLVDAGLSPLQALQSATTTPADVFGTANRTGRIQAGMDADIVLLEANPLSDIRNIESIKAVLTQGVWLDRRRLGQMRSSAKGTHR